MLPVIRRIFAALGEYDQPKIYFPGINSGELLTSLQDIQADVIGLDWKVSLSEGRRRIGSQFAVQGNLDPTVLMAPMPVIKQYAERIIDEGQQEAGFIFNLGHGLFPEASIEKLEELTEHIHDYSRKTISWKG